MEKDLMSCNLHFLYLYATLKYYTLVDMFSVKESTLLIFVLKSLLLPYLRNSNKHFRGSVLQYN